MIAVDLKAGSKKRLLHTWALPNLLTYGRVLAVPLLAVCFYIDGQLGHWLGFAVFVAAGISDFFDGYLARVWQQQSIIGKMLDPIADKLIVAVAILLLVWAGVIGYWSLPAAIIILAREIFVSGLREFLAELRASMPVTCWAKVKTDLQMGAIGLLIISPVADTWFGDYADLAVVTNGGLALLWLSALVTIYTGYLYAKAGVHHIAKEQEEE